MKEWNVYVNGKYVGCVNATDESTARCFAMCKFDTTEDDDIEVSPR